jgi:hypothetical protein
MQTIVASRIPALVVALALMLGGCGKPSPESGLRDSFAAQVAANKAITDFKRQGDDLFFTGPGVDGGTAHWRIHIDSSVIEATDDERAPLKGMVKSSWYANDQNIKPSASGRDSNLPVPLTSTGLAQDCWALWNPKTSKWGWE